jgi:Na+/phosphate symporter
MSDNIKIWKNKKGRVTGFTLTGRFANNFAKKIMQPNGIFDTKENEMAFTPEEQKKFDEVTAQAKKSLVDLADSLSAATASSMKMAIRTLREKLAKIEKDLDDATEPRKN